MSADTRRILAGWIVIPASIYLAMIAPFIWMAVTALVPLGLGVFSWVSDRRKRRESPGDFVRPPVLPLWGRIIAACLLFGTGPAFVTWFILSHPAPCADLARQDRLTCEREGAYGQYRYSQLVERWGGYKQLLDRQRSQPGDLAKMLRITHPSALLIWAVCTCGSLTVLGVACRLFPDPKTRKKNTAHKSYTPDTQLPQRTIGEELRSAQAALAALKGKWLQVFLIGLTSYNV